MGRRSPPRAVSTCRARAERSCFATIRHSASGATGRIAFFGDTAYAANSAAFNDNVFVTTPITSDAAGNIYFGYKVTGTNPANLQSGIARISASGVGSFVAASAASGDSGITQVAANSAPALSLDGSTVYVAVSTGNFGRGALVALNSATLATTAVRPLIDPVSGNASSISDNGTASPTVGPDGRVYFGVLENPFRTARGWLLSFGADLSASAARPPGGFGWDDTVSIVPSAMVPSYGGAAPYLLMAKYNDYGSLGGTGINRLAILDPTVAAVDPRTGATTMNIVMSIAGPTPDPDFPGLAGAVREWCINTAAVDPFTDSVLVNSEDGKLYRWRLDTNTFTENIVLTPGLGEAYTPTLIGGDGKVYAINNGTLFAVGAASVPEPSGLASMGFAALWLWRRGSIRRPRGVIRTGPRWGC